MKDQLDHIGRSNRYVDWHLEGDPKTEALTNGLMATLRSCHKPRVASSRKFMKVVEHCLDQLLLNLIQTVQDGTCALWLPSNRTFYNHRAYFHGPYVTYNGMMVARNFLRSQGIVTVTPGRASRNVSFRVPTSIALTAVGRRMLFAQRVAAVRIRQKRVHLIRMKTARDEDNRRRLVPFEASPVTDLIEANLEATNALLASTDVRLDLPIDMLTAMNVEIEHKALIGGLTYRPLKLVLDGYLYRVFNDETFDHGGRIYGCDFQNVPKAYRPHITINGSPTIEADFSAMHPTMLMAELDLQMHPSFDPYGLAGDELRPLVKVTFNALLNARSTNIDQVPEFDSQAAGMTWRAWVKYVIQAMGPLTQFLGSGCGIKLQRKDSDIAEAIIMKFVDRGIPILPIHDSFLVQAQHEQLLIDTMKTVFYDKVGYRCEVKVRRRAAVSEDELRFAA